MSECSSKGEGAPQILVLTGELPAPPTDGDRIVNYGLLQALAERFTVTLLTNYYRNRNTEADIEDIRKLGVEIWFVGEPDHRQGAASNLRRGLIALRRDIPLRYASRLASECERLLSIGVTSRVRCVVHLDNYRIACVGKTSVSEIMHVHNVEGWSASIVSPPGRIAAAKHAEEVRRIRRVERRAFRTLAAVTTTSIEEARRLETLYGRTVTDVVPSGVKVGQPSARYDVPGVVLWIGNFSYDPNVSGLRHFLRSIWPLVRASTGAKLLVVGANPPRDLMDEHNDGVDFRGFVEDLDQVTSISSVGIVPLWDGGAAGIKLKTITLMASGLPVVTTPIGAEGLDDLPAGAAAIAEDDVNFANAVIDLLQSSSSRSQVGRDGRSYVQSNLTWETVGNRLLSVIDRVVMGDGST